jgi:microcystin-dependent protein
MSSIQLQGNSSGTGVMTVSSPNTNTNYTITLPQANTTLVGTDATQTLTNKTITDAVSLEVDGNTFLCTTSGNVGIGTSSPAAKLQVVGGAIMPSAGVTSSDGILFPPNPGGGGGDSAWIRYYVRSGEETTFEIGTSDNPTDHIALMTSGNVGIGTISPENKLQVISTGIAIAAKGAGETRIVATNSTSGITAQMGSESYTAYVGSLTNNSFVLRSNDLERFRVGAGGGLGIAGANYGSSGQVLTSAGSDTAPTWSNSVGSPVGTVIYFAASTAPTGYLKANGAVISRTTYASLFAVIGTTFGVGDNSTTFGLPDLRGEFLRGWDDGRGVDSGRAFGTFQDYLVQSHIHSMWNAMSRDSTQGDPNATNAGTFSGGGGQFYAHPNTDTYGGTETRPRNIDLLACIKYI